MANFPELSLLPFIAEHAVIRYGICFWLVWIICLVVSPPNLLHTPQSVHWGKQIEKALMLCKHCSAKARTLVCYQYCFGQKSKTAPYELL